MPITVNGNTRLHAVHDLTAARKNARTDADAAAIAWAQDEIARLRETTRAPNTIPTIHVPDDGVMFKEVMEEIIFDALWTVAREHRLEAITPAGTRYAVTGDIIRQMAGSAFAAIVN